MGNVPSVPFRGAVLFLEGGNAEDAAAECFDAGNSGLRARQRRDARHAVLRGHTADRLLIEVGMRAHRRVDYQRDFLAFDQVHRVGTAFGKLEYSFHR